MLQPSAQRPGKERTVKLSKFVSSSPHPLLSVSLSHVQAPLHPCPFPKAALSVTLASLGAPRTPYFCLAPRSSSPGLHLAKTVYRTEKVPLLYPSPSPPTPTMGEHIHFPYVFCTRWEMMWASVTSPLLPGRTDGLPLLVTALLSRHPRCQDSALGQASSSPDLLPALLSSLFLAWPSPGKAES